MKKILINDFLYNIKNSDYQKLVKLHAKVETETSDYKNHKIIQSNYNQLLEKIETEQTGVKLFINSFMYY